ncbi:hypothetical protein HHK36_004864 [Tetracentron sinense]|uniref:EF-hand domain-containing protein n=1 Tax=Tetracentron sinense TaxID=13715 RepID=A0A834Z604_TETSI|nr:hypothetical protein HHK36_015357 [Tetracentron sinense]KAF8408791.1 hypothetical protein HHK36_004860 [Tetracentron sinense]KAF8408795.1 hypothetical protein HHK36_004864 [Tetracentron sinense]
MEKTSSNTISSSFSIAECIGLFLIRIILFWVSRIHKFYSSFQSPLRSQLDFIVGKSKVCIDRKNSISEFSSREFCVSEKEDDGQLCRGDMEIVMESLGIMCNSDGDKLQETRLGSDEVAVMFEEKEPSLEEVKEAFDVFDENRDGLIDAMELQRVLCSLGFREGSEVEDCKRMIAAFDENGDERIDFNEFVKFMENSSF